MMPEPGELMSRYFDDLLSEEEFRQLQDWLRSSPDHVREFSRAALLHDQLRGEHLARSLALEPVTERHPVARVSLLQRWQRLAVSAGIAAACLVLFAMLLEIGRTPVSAAAELTRLIAAQEAGLDRTYRMDVEDVAVPRRSRHKADEDGRPPKPPLDGAVLHLRPGHQFVLIRPLPDGESFVTGSDGQTSWAVRPDGPVRVSGDLTRFNRDLPGHEHDIPLIHMEQGLEHLRSAYEIQLLPIEDPDDFANDRTSTRLLVAVKRRGDRGPQRVEITYAVPTGRIHQIRFIGMPYGPDHLTVRLTLMDERDLGPRFFEHRSHHAPDRDIEEE